MLNRFRFSCVVLLTLAVGLSPGDAGDLKLKARYRSETEAGSGRYHTIRKPLHWKPQETAIVICDMWDKHWCPQSTARVGELAPRMNQVVSSARSSGVLIIHCPSDTLDFYKDTPQRRMAQAAPRAETKTPLQNWCHLDKAVESVLPIDDSDGGCDCEQPVRNFRAWSRQHPAIEIHKGDAITDSAEAYYLMKQREIKNVIVMGVHTNMCVLGRPFSIRQMVQQGQNVVLMRDMTDTMYNPAMAPFVSHFTGTDLVVEHIEKYWCPTILSTDFVKGSEFRFSGDNRKHLVVLCAEREYQTEESLPEFAIDELGHDFRVSFVWADADNRNNLPGIEIAAQADVLLISVRRRTLPAEQLQFVRDFVAAGKPVVGIRTASHAFCQRNKPAPTGLADWPEFDQQVFGGNYTNHYGSGPKTNLQVVPKLTGLAAQIIEGINIQENFAGNGSLYKVSPLATSATPILTGQIPGQNAEPVAWLNRRADGGSSFYTSLGHRDDFQQSAFRQLLKQALVTLSQ